VQKKVAIIYNRPSLNRYDVLGEQKAVLGVVDSVKAVYHSLLKKNLVTQVPLSPPLSQVKETLRGLQADVVFNLFEGFDDNVESEAIVAGLLSQLGMVYTGCAEDILTLASDKIKAKEFLTSVGIATPRYQALTPETLSNFALSFPCIVKPVRENASHGLNEKSVINNLSQLGKQVLRISSSYGGRALVEEFIGGREFNITVWGSKTPSVLPISEIIYSLPPDLPSILTFKAKWEPRSKYFKSTKAICPANIDTQLQKIIETIALKIFTQLNCSAYLRVDFRLNGSGNPEVLDINPNPDISPGTGAARQAKAAGMNYDQFVRRIILLALEKKELVHA
jgi:D-alanine-D-alanine ligase